MTCNLFFSFSTSGSSSQATLWLFLHKIDDHNDNFNDNDVSNDDGEFFKSQLLLSLFGTD